MCPLCEIQAIVESHILEQYLNEAVMERETRYAVNAKGFCSKHFDMLFARQSKLGLALQCVTRMNVLKEELKVPENAGNARKYGKKILASAKTCVICDAVDEHMQRYFKTVAELYLAEEDFRELLVLTKGFCLSHYAGLLMNARYAGLKTKEYLKALATVESGNFERVQKDLQWFCDKHDFKNAGQDLGTGKDALPRTRVKIYGKK